jgi:hypothetical protein
MTLRDRAAAMRLRVLDRVKLEPWNRSDIDNLDSALSAALAHRDALLGDDHDIDLLHPARVVLILLDDARINDPATLAGAALIESERRDLATPLADRHTRVPTPLDRPLDELAEALLDLPAASLAAAIAERLDHARHLHLRPIPLWRDRLALEESVYLPIAARASDALARRYQRWHSAFIRRLERSG